MTAKIHLTVISKDSVAANDTVFKKPPGKPDGPYIVGKNKDESLACGACGNVLVRHLSTRELYETIETQGRFVLHCKCDAYNVAPSSRYE